MEVCVDSVLSAVNAERGGARRIELCANLLEGGTTPSVGMLTVLKKMVHIPVYAMIRPRGGDFLYSDEEFEVMREDVKILKANGADGIVIGMLKSDGTVDAERCSTLIDLARPLSVTFHRAIDMCRSLTEALETVIAIGCQRVLTSGGECSAFEGAPTIADMIKQAGGRAVVMPGGGITERNVSKILEITGAREFHGSARIAVSSEMIFRSSHITMGGSFSPPEYSIKITDPERVKQLISISKGIN